jgi:hypothetical protein
MGETKKIVVDHYPVERLPQELRAGLEAGQIVTVTVEGAEEAATAPALATYVGTAKGAYTTPEDALAHIRRMRDEWE